MRVLALLAIPTFAAICFSVVAVNGMLWLLYTWLPDLLRARFHLSLQNAGLLATGYVQTALIAGLFCGGPAGDYLMRWGRYGRICVMISGLAVCAPFVYWIGRSESLDGVRLAAAGYGFFKGLFTANYVAAALDLLPDNAHGFCSGILNAIGDLAGGLAAYLFGLFQGRFAVGEMFGVASVLGLVAALVLAATAWRFFAKDYARYHTAAALM